MYKHDDSSTPQIVGKRIICANRYGRRGCGHTRQLYLADIIPKRQYRLSTIIAFIKALLGGMLVEQAYLNAIDACDKEARHAWRWAKDCFKQLSVWRTILSKPVEAFIPTRQPEALKHVLPTLERLMNASNVSDIDSYQVRHQCAFF